MGSEMVGSPRLANSLLVRDMRLGVSADWPDSEEESGGEGLTSRSDEEEREADADAVLGRATRTDLREAATIREI